MPEPQSAMDELLHRLRGAPGLAPLVAEAVTTWQRRAAASRTGPDGGADAGVEGPSEPGWRAFSDAFPTFWEFTNRPR